MALEVARHFPRLPWEGGSSTQQECLGARFPGAALKHHRGGRQALIQKLYSAYTALSFTNPADRSVGILGLERRLARALSCQAAWGVFEAYVGRGLLWQRRRAPTGGGGDGDGGGDDQTLESIAYPPGREVPSWSWMACSGAIDYLDAPFGGVEWLVEDGRRGEGDDEGRMKKNGSPANLRRFFTESGPPIRTTSRTRRELGRGPDAAAAAPHLEVRINRLRDDVTAAVLKPTSEGSGSSRSRTKVIFDREKNPTSHLLRRLRCVVLGVEAGCSDNDADAACYVLLVAPSSSVSSPSHVPLGGWLRVGVAQLLARHLLPAAGDWAHVY